jgi:hypothetical protein
MPAACILLLAAGLATGCVRRTISITSDPDGALVFLNHREIGRTPVEIEFLYYGDYDVRLMKDGYEPLIARAEAEAPLWDTPPFDLAAEAVPDTRHRIEWHYDLAPVVENNPALLERAGQLRGKLNNDIADSEIQPPEDQPPPPPENAKPPAAEPGDRP